MYCCNDVEAHKKWVKDHFDQTIFPQVFAEGDLVLLDDEANDKLGAGKFEPMWHGSYIVKHVLQKGAYELVYYEGNVLSQPHNGLYLKKYYAWLPRNYFCTLVYEFISV